MSDLGNIYKTTKITAIKEETLGVKSFTITYADGSAIPYISGQFITFIFNHHGTEERRSYSISSCAELGEPLSVTVKRIDNGSYSRYLIDKAVVGELMYSSGVAGLFTLSRNPEFYRQYFFFAAGIGITPIFSLVKALLHTQPSVKAVLIYSNRWEESVIFLDEINELAARYSDRFKVEYLYSTSKNLGRARLNKGLLPVLLNEYGKVDRSKMLFYVCGPYNYMRMVNLSLEEHNVESEQIRKENFRPFERPRFNIEPSDKKTHKVTVRHDGKEQMFNCQYPDTILHAAKRNGINLPYSCEVGRCGSCAARCTTGKVWLSYNEVLMDIDLAHGSILTCTGHPIGGDVVIEL